MNSTERQLRSQLSSYEEVFADHRRLVRELDVAMHGEEGAAKQASLCDLVPLAAELRAKLAAAKIDYEAQLSATEAKRLRAVASMEAISQDLADAIQGKDAAEEALKGEQAHVALLKMTVGKLATAELKREQLAVFSCEIIRTECWGYQPEINGGDIQEIAEKLGLIEASIATEADAAVMNEVCAGDRIYRFVPWLDKNRAGLTQEQPNV